MKKFVLIFFCNLIIYSLQAQSGSIDTSLSMVYVKAAIGGGVGINGELSSDNNNGQINTLSTKNGTGIYISGALGYQYSANLGAELEMGYFSGVESNAVPPYGGNFEIQNGKMWQLTPSIVFSIPTRRFGPYIKTGLIIAIPTVFDDHYSTTVWNGTQYNFEEKIKYYGNIATGLQTTIGCNYQINNKLCLFTEAAITNIGYIPSNAEIYYATLNGVDQLYSFSQKEEVLKKSGTYYTTGNPNQPVVLPQVKFTFGGIYINAGVKLNIANSFSAIQTSDDRRGYYARLNAGYGFPINSDLFDNYSTTVSMGSNVTTIETTVGYVASFSAGNGFNASLGGGYMVTQNVGFDLGFNEVISKTFMSPGLTYLGNNESKFYILASQHGDMFQVNPSIVFATKIKPFTLYTRLGLIVGFGNMYRTNIDPYQSSGSTYVSTQTVWKYSGGIAIGYNTTLGLSYPLTSKLDLYAEACFNTIYDGPQNAQMTEYMVNGMDNLSNENTHQRNQIFKQSYSENDNNDPNKPTISSPVKFCFNAVVASFGIKVWL